MVETCEQVFAATPCLCWDAPFDELNVAKPVCEELFEQIAGDE